MHDAHLAIFFKKNIFRYNFLFLRVQCKDQNVDVWVMGHLVTQFQVGPCRVPRYPSTRPINRVPGSVLPVLLPESEILCRDKQDRQEDLPLETAKHFVRYALPTKLSRCNDNASHSLSGLRHRLRNRVRLCQDWQLLCLSFYFRVPGYPTVTGIGYPVQTIRAAANNRVCGHA